MSLTLHPHNPAPIEAGLLDRWRRIPVAVAVDLTPSHQIDPGVRALLPPGRQPALVGRALTVRGAPPDFGPVRPAPAVPP